DRFRLYAHGKKYINNSFVPYFYGRIESINNVTRITGRISMHPFVRIFMALWFGALAIGGIIIPVSLWVTRPGEGTPSLTIAIVPLFMILFGVGLTSFGRWFARDQRARLEQFIERDLQAHALS